MAISDFAKLQKVNTQAKLDKKAIHKLSFDV